MESLFSPDEVLAQLTLDEKISLLSGKSMWSLRDVPRLRVPSIRVSDGPQGLRKAVTEITALESFPATCFPTACALACSWNTSLMHQVGQALAEECRDQNVQVLLGPGLNIRRHVCGGRNFEYFSEDPIVSGHLAAALVQGIQFSGSVGACVKHVCVNNQESWRFRVNVLVDERTLREVYLKGFEFVIKNAQPWSLMCAYNQLNGIYCSENAKLFQDIVRREWGFSGLVMTDWGATNRRVAGIQAGVDLEMPGTYGIHNEPIKKALQDNTLTHEQLNDAVLRNLQLIHRAARGMSNNNNDNNKHHLASIQQELYQQHHEMAYQAALECIVLLQNTNGLLPLTRSSQQSQQQPHTSSNTKVALIGDFCQDPRYQGMGSSKVNSTKVDTVLEHISKYTDNYVYSRGYLNSDDNDDNTTITSRWTMREQDNVASQREALIQEAVDNAKNADVVILLTGVPEILESEGFDRENIYLPAHHNELIHRVCQVNPNVIVVLSNGGPVLMPWKDHVKAICECYLLGQAGARALLDVLFGVVSPSGKLTETFPTSLETVPSNLYFPGNSHTVEYREGLQVGYRYYDTAHVPVLFPFGHGLSYTLFDYTNCRCNVIMMNPTTTTTTKAALVQVECCMTNVGKMAGAEIVQLYVHQTHSQVYQPEQQLRDFAKTKILQPGESENVVFTLTKDAFAFFDVGVSDWIMEEGATYEIRLAASSRDILWTGTITCNDIAAALGGESVSFIGQPSQDACTSHPPLRNKQCLAAPLTVDDAAFHAMLDTHPFDLMFLSSRSLLGQHLPGEAANPAAVETAAAAAAVGSSPSRRPLVATPAVMTQVLPHEIDVIHRNSFLSEIERNGCFGNLFAKIIMKAMETEMEDPNDPKQKKMIREVARNLPLRCLATFSRGNMSFDLLDSLIALFNGHYAGAISHLSSSSRKAATSLIGRR